MNFLNPVIVFLLFIVNLQGADQEETIKKEIKDFVQNKSYECSDKKYTFEVKFEKLKLFILSKSEYIDRKQYIDFRMFRKTYTLQSATPQSIYKYSVVLKGKSGFTRTDSIIANRKPVDISTSNKVSFGFKTEKEAQKFSTLVEKIYKIAK